MNCDNATYNENYDLGGLKQLFIGCCDVTKNVTLDVSICKVNFSTLLGPLEKISKKVNLVFLAVNLMKI